MFFPRKTTFFSKTLANSNRRESDNYENYFALYVRQRTYAADRVIRKSHITLGQIGIYRARVPTGALLIVSGRNDKTIAIRVRK